MSIGPISEPRRQQAIESRWSVIEATASEQRALQELGQVLAHQRSTDTTSNNEPARSVIQLRRAHRRRCEVRVVDAVGVVATPSLVLDVQPKIPYRHLLYLLERSQLLPRMDVEQATLAPDQTLLELVARWFLTALERLLEQGLARGYRPAREQAAVARGRVLPLPTTQSFYRGRLQLVSDGEEYDFDTPLNRLLLRATRLLAQQPTLPEQLKAQARRGALRMDGVGELEEADRHAQVDRATAAYRDAALLARQLVDGIGRGILAGEEIVWTFLIRTPEAVEQGLRIALCELLAPVIAPTKRPIAIAGSDLLLNPDLVFGRQALAEVKYKLAPRRWKRPDLYELVAFATGAEVRHAAMIDFATTTVPRLSTLQLGRVSIRHLAWLANEQTKPSTALGLLADEVHTWSREWSRSPQGVTGAL
jgi:5-methylcytosine-specific restriction enzyme subunit McrC